MLNLYVNVLAEISKFIAALVWNTPLMCQAASFIQTREQKDA